jgi:hypothetical protein
MLRLTTLKMSLLSALATLFLLVAMLASTGTASAHTTSSQTPALQPHITVFMDGPISAKCKSFFVQGTGFVPGPVHLSAIGYKYPLTLGPNGVPANANGNFSQDLIICGTRFGSPHAHAILFATGSDGAVSNKVPV